MNQSKFEINDRVSFIGDDIICAGEIIRCDGEYSPTETYFHGDEVITEPPTHIDFSYDIYDEQADIMYYHIPEEHVILKGDPVSIVSCFKARDEYAVVGFAVREKLYFRAVKLEDYPDILDKHTFPCRLANTIWTRGRRLGPQSAAVLLAEFEGQHQPLMDNVHFMKFLAGSLTADSTSLCKVVVDPDSYQLMWEQAEEKGLVLRDAMDQILLEFCESVLDGSEADLHDIFKHYIIFMDDKKNEDGEKEGDTILLGGKNGIL